MTVPMLLTLRSSAAFLHKWSLQTEAPQENLCQDPSLKGFLVLSMSALLCVLGMLRSFTMYL